MKRACVLLLPATLLLVLATSACNDESKPIITRVRLSPACGVAPLNVETFAAVSGGNETGDPLGGTNNLDVIWNFGDGGSGNTSVNFHKYRDPGEYTVIVTATDPDGNSATSSVPVTVMADSLVITAESAPAAGAIPVDQKIQFGITARSCAIDYPTALGDSVKMAFRWEVGDVDSTYIYTGSAPQHTFSVAGEYDVLVKVTDPAQAVTRSATLHYSVAP